MAKILVVGLNPAWQQVFSLPSLRVGGVNRAGDFQVLASGKGINAAKALARLGHEVSLLQVLAGVRGGRCLEGCEVYGVRSLHAWANGETRTCVTLLHGGAATEIISPFSVSVSAGAGLAGQLLAQVSEADKYAALLVCGTMPAGLHEDFYGSVGDRVRAPLTIWDSVAGLTPEVLARVTWLKVNASEHAALAPILEASAARPSLLVTDGPAPALVHAGGEAWTCAVPPLEQAVNPIGAGDTATALLAHGLLRGLDAKAAVSHALAAASASCLNPLPAEWDPADAARLEAGLRWAAA
jgi:fructose-1-phosphate kinase PfkB-like protein